jgi:signal transduction histidine kinase
VHVDGRRIEISDAGPGIPVEARDAVFEPFYRLDRSRNVHTGGSGLGLAIVRQLCQAQGWRIRIEESTEGGAKFVLDL